MRGICIYTFMNGYVVFRYVMLHLELNYFYYKNFKFSCEVSPYIKALLSYSLKMASKKPKHVAAMFF